jgi:hypothetical protein
MKGIIRLLTILANLLQGFLNQRKQAKVQEERDELEADPASWYDGHFDGLRKHNESATEASETNTEDNKEDGRRDLS